jgi:Putative zinc-finger
MSSWHADASMLGAWVEGTAGPITSASIEQHLLRCEQCRAAVAGLVPAEDVAGAWDGVLARVAGPAGPVERVLVRLGLQTGDARVVGAAPVLRIAWAAGLAAVLGFILVASIAGHDRGLALFLALAPLMPVAAVAAAYGPSADPSYELVVAAPYRMIRLVLLRSAAVLLTAVPITVAAGLLLPLEGATAVAWVLPSLGFTLVVLGAGSWVDPWAAAVAVGVGWVAAVAVSARLGDVLAVLAPSALVGYAALVVAGTLILALATPAWRLDGQWSPVQPGRERT